MLERIQGWVICDTAFMPLIYLAPLARASTIIEELLVHRPVAVVFDASMEADEFQELSWARIFVGERCDEQSPLDHFFAGGFESGLHHGHELLQPGIPENPMTLHPKQRAMDPDAFGVFFGFSFERSSSQRVQSVIVELGTVSLQSKQVNFPKEIAASVLASRGIQRRQSRSRRAWEKPPLLSSHDGVGFTP